MAIACVGCATLPRVLDLISLGADAAAARGVDVARAERLALVSASLSTGAAVSLGGPVAFVGIIVPHIVRLIVGADHRLVLPASALFGASFLIGCDLVARTIVRADRAAGRHRHGHHRRTVLSMAARQARHEDVMMKRRALIAAGRLRRARRARRIAVPRARHLAHSGDDRDAVRDGRGDRLIAVGSYDHFPPEAQKLPRVGALLDPDIERILSLQPDLVDRLRDADGAEAAARPRQHPVLLVRAPGDARHHGDDPGARRAHRLRRAGQRRWRVAWSRQLAAVRAAVAGRPRPRTLLVFEREPASLQNIYASGGYGFLHDMLDVAGGDNVFGDIKQQSVQAEHGDDPGAARRRSSSSCATAEREERRPDAGPARVERARLGAGREERSASSFWSATSSWSPARASSRRRGSSAARCIRRSVGTVNLVIWSSGHLVILVNVTI